MSNYRSTCSTCKFFDIDASRARDHGLCQVNPPTVPNMSVSDTGVWPRVTPGSWCGAHQPDIERGRLNAAHLRRCILCGSSYLLRLLTGYQTVGTLTPPIGRCRSGRL